MKTFLKSFKLLFLLIIISNLASAQMYEKGMMVADLYYGFPNLITSVLRTKIDSSAKNTSNPNHSIYSNIHISSFGPIGGRFEYLLTDRVGFGADISYANTIATYIESGDGYNYQASIPRWRIVPRFNIHFGDDLKFDPYFAFGIGYHSEYRVLFSTNDPYYTGPTTSEVVLFPVPAVVMIKFGARYFITDHFGLGVEAGIGGPLATGGITVKF